MAESQAWTLLGDRLFEDPSQLSQALHQRGGSESGLHFTTSAESRQSGNTASTGNLAVPLFVALSRPHHAPSPRRAAATRHVKPSLPKHNSAPTSTAFTFPLEGALKMHHTFNGMDAPGDTQPDSQMHKQWTSGALSSVLGRENHMPPPKSLFVEHDDDDDENDENDLPSDDLEVVESSQEGHHAHITSPTVIDVDEQGDSGQDSLAQTSPFKFETPAMASRKRDGSGQPLSSAARTNTTPGTVASASAFGTAFGNVAFAGGPTMSLTQIWNNTQAPTSPVAAGASEDIVFTRPSPNFNNIPHSSPGPSYSSPIKHTRPDTPASEPMIRSSSEPRTEYVTMKQSQEKRRESNGEEATVVPPHDSWEDQSRAMQLRIARKHFHQKAARSLSHVSAPPDLSRRGRKPKSKANADYPSPGQSRVSRSLIGGNNSEVEDDSMDEAPSPPEPVESHNRNNNDHNDVSIAQATMFQNSSDNRIQVPKTSSHPTFIPSGPASRNSSQQPTPSSQLERQSQIRAPGSQILVQGSLRPQSTADSIAIMDSQPDVLADFDSVPPPRLLRFPSSPSQNQYSINQTTIGTKTGYTSQVISSSVPPMPPQSSPDEPIEADDAANEPEDARVPSSPPLMTHDDDDDVVYDEHGYDEYAEGVADGEDDEPALGGGDGAGDDVVMQDEDDLPIIKDEPDKPTVTEADEETDDEEGDLVQVGKVDTGTDQEVPETLEEDEQVVEPQQEAVPDTLISASQGGRNLPRLKRQDTIPETDALDETQPSAFSNHMTVDSAGNRDAVPHHTNSTEVFGTAQEEQSGSQGNQQDPRSSKEAGSLDMDTSNRIRSMNDILNLPETQQSADGDDLEIPRFSGFEEEEAAMLLSPPARPSKKPKTTYKVKHVFRSPAKPTSSVLSDPPASSPHAPHPLPTIVNSPPTASGQLREDLGANVAAQAREDAQAPYSRPATLKAKTLPRSSKLQATRKGALKSISRSLMQSLSSPGTSPSKSKAPATDRKVTPVTPSKAETITNEQADVEMPDVEYSPDELARVTPPAVPLERLLERLSQESAVPLGEVLVPNRVFASWPGKPYFPATCVGRATSHELRIRFDDGNATNVDPVRVRNLELRPGDHVKIDQPGMRKNIYVVVECKDKIEDLDREQFPATDRYGHATVIVEEKRRDSMPAAKVTQPAEQISVPMASIYLTTGLWTRIRDRRFNFSPAASPAKSVSHVGTPAAETMMTPSFTRRGTAIPSFLKSATARAASVASTNRSESAVFANMAFVLTSTADDFDKDALAKTIKSNGGMVLQQGFHELFDYDSSDRPSSSQGRRRSSSPPVISAGLALKPMYKDLSFVALISDSHSRSTKYIQALALNVPCLHLRWIQDSLTTTRAVPFMRYLLPAGVSKFLDPTGVVRSRTMAPYDPAAEDLTFDTTLQDRPLLLHNQSVLLVTGKSKKEIEKRQPFVFLTHALGSANVGRCADLSNASEMLSDGHWDWVYVDNNEIGLLEAAAELFGTEVPAPSSTAPDNKSKKGKKRKRDDAEEKEELLVRVVVGGKKIRITCSEFVIQSLILGALIEE
ncbi:hypothetical protein NX059_009698 [Plenodomus lindquistii]|nr:hypothetical protein NX059_009698 [Plenodomus lindquistii]